MENTVIIFSIDDGRSDMYRLAKEILMPEKLPATLNITTHRDSGGIFPNIKREELNEIFGCPLFEIANHSATHKNEFEDIYKGYLTICEWFNCDNTLPVGFASPNSEMSIEYIEDNIEQLNKIGVKYVRTCREDFFNREANTVALTSYPVMFTTSVETMKKMADIAVENKYCLIYVFHSVLKKGEKNYGHTWSYDYDKFKEFVSYIKDLQNKGFIEVMTTMEYVNMRFEEK